MMKLPRPAIGMLVAALLFGTVPSTPVTFSAPAVTKDGCRDRVVKELGIVHDEFRARIFGSRKDADGKFAVLTGGFSAQRQKGILETKKRLASELVTPVVESYRTYRCRSVAVCSVMNRSFADVPGTYKVHPLGCESQDLSSYDECDFKGTGGQTDITSLTQECGTMVDDSLKAERAVLRLALSYDAGYRAALQLGGMIDWMQMDLPNAALKPIRDMIGMLGKLHEIPCFIGQCDKPDTSIIQTPGP